MPTDLSLADAPNLPPDHAMRRALAIQKRKAEKSDKYVTFPGGRRINFSEMERRETFEPLPIEFVPRHGEFYRGAEAIHKNLAKAMQETVERGIVGVYLGRVTNVEETPEGNTRVKIEDDPRCLRGPQFEATREPPLGPQPLFDCNECYNCKCTTRRKHRDGTACIECGVMEYDKRDGCYKFSDNHRIQQYAGSTQIYELLESGEDALSLPVELDFRAFTLQRIGLPTPMANNSWEVRWIVKKAPRRGYDIHHHLVRHLGRVVK